MVPDYRVYLTHREKVLCDRCGKDVHKGNLIALYGGEGAHCMTCAGMDDLVILPSGDPALTRRAAKLSSRKFPLFEFVRSIKMSSRKGTLVEPEALKLAQKQCAEDAEKRLLKQERAAEKRKVQEAKYRKDFAVAVLKQYPGCPEKNAHAIAAHACEKYSGRVGRAAFAKEMDPEAIRLAVRAHIRHAFTKYDELLAEMGPSKESRRIARHEISDDLDTVEQKWANG